MNDTPQLPQGTSLEEAQKCPKCERPGEIVREEPKVLDGYRKVKLLHIYCRTPLCPWLNTPYFVQVNEDGSIPQPYSQLGEKQFPKFSQETMTRIEDSIRAQLDAEVKPGAEVRNPRG